ncbi:hypothetical protein PF002_g25356 [Phytophthora fragariae]|uniref:Uncharacterized protein n=1 Tax=Phytophthora fragariae TaxID=53985 RepID=A0A6A3RRN3_9STRA|nr:hypothetical protein PF003_g14984 [Phytophthora fragariae]KAE8923563.1 hypothetical protein PF009_g26189 [Phytophthora fragariae]KAE9072464.1 hypothetical protein PF007_g26165 [Phytophthora fragariae]KAE9102076.1 hypothetical protein PF006_g22519 [Phytophthora fragariae]KAE9179532.1 hypothetical protein PF004_g25126 [Phytophthora fragariae]
MLRRSIRSDFLAWLPPGFYSASLLGSSSGSSSGSACDVGPWRRSTATERPIAAAIAANAGVTGAS